MKNWSTGPIFGRRAVKVPFSGHQQNFQTACRCFQDIAQDHVTQGMHGTKKSICRTARSLLMTKVTAPQYPLPSRAQRLQASTREVENLYYRHAANDNLASSQPKSSLPSQTSNSARTESSLFPSGQHQGVPLSKAVLEGQIPRSGNRPYQARGSGDVVDARNLGVPSRQRSTNERFKQQRITPVDARNLQARPQPRQESTGFARPNGSSSSPKKDTFGLPNRQRLPPRQPSSHDEIDRAPPIRQLSGNVSREPSDRYGSGSDSLRGQGPRDDGGQGSFSRVAGIQRGRPREGSGRPQASREREGGNPRRRERRKEGRPSSNAPIEMDLTPEEEAYLEEKRKREAGHTLEFEPAPFDQATFSGTRPAVVSGELGMSEILGEKLMLAKKYMDRDFIEWQSREQKADTMTLVKKLKATKKNDTGEQGKDSTSVEAESDKESKNLLGKVLGGNYHFTQPLQGKDVLGHVARQSDKNESYFPDDQMTLLEKVKSLMPQDAGGKGGQGVKTAAKA